MEEHFVFVFFSFEGGELEDLKVSRGGFLVVLLVLCLTGNQDVPCACGLRHLQGLP